jgi:3-isopropylmalate/(R)-2-methylmalate dehydratase small subunit
MRAFKLVTSIAAPIAIKDVDTDMIIPAQYLTSISREGFGEGLFVRLRQSRPDFYQNQPRLAAAQIIVADSNFGCGSSREHAVWALLDAGVRVVIAPSFADIFAGNSAKNGLLLVTLPQSDVHGLLAKAQSEDLTLSVDLELQQVREVRGSAVWSFEYDQFRKHCLLNGLDDLDYLRSRSAVINQKREELAKNIFFSSLKSNH